jgi:flagellar basal-body rod modification protein FlgD
MGKSTTAMASTPSDTSGTSSSSSDSSTISANDFLTLLVTEMQNQDPTADTDPNEYINQLVQVNSLEQLIDINQNLSTALGSSATSDSSSATGQANSQTASTTGKSSAGSTAQAQSATQKGGALAATQSAASNAATASTAAAHAVGGGVTAPGNLSIPAAKPAAHRVAQALDGRHRMG